jgi:predicted acyl esterase
VPQADSRQLSDMFNGEYVTVHASVRGTGCSSGEFDLFSWRSALDGKEIIDNWIPDQPWSNGDVGILGHSYGGITGFMVAATQPQHLKAATVSGLIDDLYRGMAYPGGASNYGVPLLWTGGIRPAYDVGGGLLPGPVRPQRPGDSPNRREQCATNAAGKSRTVANDHIVGAYQDEQTGPRGPAHLFERIGGVPKRLMLSNGNHDTESTAEYGVADIRNDRKAWRDHWMRGVDGGFGNLRQARSSVSVLFETHRDANNALVPNGRKDARTFPLLDTRWTDWYLHGDGSLSTTAPTGAEPSQPYFTGTKRQFWSYQAGGDVGPPLTTADRHSGSDHGDALPGEQRA